MSFCLEPNSQQEPAAQSSPPLWGLLVYILLTETLSIDDEILMEELDLPVPFEDVSSTQRSGRKGTTNEEVTRANWQRSENHYSSLAHGADKISSV